MAALSVATTPPKSTCPSEAAFRAVCSAHGCLEVRHTNKHTQTSTHTHTHTNTHTHTHTNTHLNFHVPDAHTRRVAESQTKEAAGTSVPKPTTFVRGLRGDTGDKAVPVQVVDLTLGVSGVSLAPKKK
jgi:hypothetical protein